MSINVINPNMKVSARSWMLISAIVNVALITICATVFFVNSSSNVEQQVLETAVVGFVSVVVLVGAVAVLLKMFSSGSVWSVTQITRVLEEYADGNYAKRIDTETDDGLKDLRVALKKLTDKFIPLQQNFESEVDRQVSSVRDSLAAAAAQNDILKENRLELLKYRLAVEHAPVHILITDDNGIILYANEAATRITGFSLQEMLGKTPRLWGGLMSLTFYRNMWKTIKEDRSSFRAEVKNRRKNGQVYEAEIRLEPILNDQNKPQFFVGIEEDVSERNAIDRMKSDFISSTSHELRTPLTNLRWGLENELARTEAGETVSVNRQTLDKLHDATLDMIDMVKLLLNLSRLEAGKMDMKPEDVRLKEILLTVSQNVRNRFRKSDIQITLTVVPADLTFTIDKTAFNHIMENLLSNAVCYSRSGSTVTVNASTNEQSVHIEVHDHGIGIPESERGHLFERFYRTANAKAYRAEGSGLGLYLTKQLVILLNGKIWFDSREGEGTTFYVDLPLVKGGSV